MSVIPCEKNHDLRERIKNFAETLKTEAHALGDHGLAEEDFYAAVFRGAVERVRGQFSAKKREFVTQILNHMQDRGFIGEWESTGGANRHDYSILLLSGRTAIIELKGCLDGNNTNIFERPPNAHEFLIWSVCTNPGADPRRNAWSGIHTRLSAEIISREERVDGLIIWDMVCGSIARPCPKLAAGSGRETVVGPFTLPPPCLYAFPSTIPRPRNNPKPRPQTIEDVHLLKAFYNCFNCRPEEINYVTFAVAHDNSDTVRTSSISRDGTVQRKSKPTAIRRSG